jgi:hypothetical protein
LHFSEVTHQRALFLQVFGLFIHQYPVQLQQAFVKHRVPGVGRVEGPVTLLRAEAQLVLQVRQPGRVDVHHLVGPRLIGDRVAGVYVAGVHQHHRAGADLKGLGAVVVIAAPRGDHADGEMLVRVTAIGDLAPIGNGACFDEGQALVAPEARRA